MCQCLSFFAERRRSILHSRSRRLRVTASSCSALVRINSTPTSYILYKAAIVSKNPGHKTALYIKFTHLKTAQYLLRYLTAAFLFLHALEPVAQAPSGGLAAHYPLNGNAADKTGSNHGVVKGGVTIAEDRFGNACGALRFDGTTGYVSVPNATGLQAITFSITLAAWFKAEKDPSGSSNLTLPLISKAGSETGTGAKAQYCLSLKKTFGNSYADIFLSSDFWVQDPSYLSHPIEFNKWYFLAITLDGTFVYVYLNNQLICQGVSMRPLPANNLALELGRDLSTGKYFRGSLDDVFVFRRGLSFSEITDLFNDQTGKIGEQVSITFPDDIQKNADAGQCSAVVAFAEPAVTTGCGKTELKQIKGLPSGSLFDAGKNVIAYEATTSTGKKVVDSFFVTISDKQAPVFQCPPDVTMRAPEGENSGIVNYPIPVATDNCPGVKVERVSGPPSGGEFPVGNTMVQYIATDASGNKAECSIRIILKETIKTIYHCTNDQVAYSPPGKYNIAVNYNEPLLKIRGTTIRMTRTKGLSSGSMFPIGVTEIEYEWNDSIAGKTVCSFKVTVLDTTSPVLTCPADIKAITPAGQKSTPLNYVLPVAYDDGIGLPVKLVSGLKSGSDFPVGVTVVTHEAQDASGNKGVCSFIITVEEEKPKQPEKIEPLPVVKQEEKEQAQPVPVVVKKEEVKEAIKEVQKPAPPPLEMKKEEKTVTATKTAEVKPEIKGKPAGPKTEEKKAPEPPVVKETEQPDKPVQPAVAKAEEKKLPEQPVVKETRQKEPAENKPAENPEFKEKKEEAEKPFFPPSAGKEKKPEPVKEEKKKTPPPVVPIPVENIPADMKPDAVPLKNYKSAHKPCPKDKEAPVFNNCPADTTIHLPVTRRGIVYYYREPAVRDNCGIDSFIQVVGSKSGCFLQVGVHPFIYRAVDPSGNYQMCTYSVIIKNDVFSEPIVVPEKIDEALSLGTDSVSYEHKAEISSCLVTAFIYDDGEEDNDTVSIIFNGQVIVNRDMIHIPEKGMIKRILVLDSGGENYIISKAWNKGKYGLNTLRIDIYDGDVANDRNELKRKKPLMSKVLHSKPGNAGGMILKCRE